jgi:hypothetical protein
MMTNKLSSGILSLITLVPVPAPASAGSPPSWDKVIKKGSSRFKVLKQFSNEAVLDKETGLVWERSPDATERSWNGSLRYCFGKQVGGRMGWRTPGIEELASLIDTTQSNPALPEGHPFIGVPTTACSYWSATTRMGVPTSAWLLECSVGAVSNSGDKSGNEDPVWCVRGSLGHDSY